MNPKVLIIGASGQIGSELTTALREIYGTNSVLASDIKEGSNDLMNSGPFIKIDATHKDELEKCIEFHKVTDVYLMAALLSATALTPETPSNAVVTDLAVSNAEACSRINTRNSRSSAGGCCCP